MYSDLNNRLIQYSDSTASLRAILFFDLNSALLIAYCPSVTLAPILVPERKSCFESTNSLRSLTNTL